MNIAIDPDSGVPAYLQLYRQLREEIVKGMYPYRSRFPSKRTCAEETGLSVITIEHAYALLCEEGYLESRERSGFFVSYTEEEVRPVQEALSDLKPMAPISFDQEAFPRSVFAKTVRNVLSMRESEILEKCPGKGLQELRQVLAAYLARSRGIQVDPEQIVIGSGSEYLYSLIVQLLGRDRIFGIEDPSYERIREMYQSLGVPTDLLKMGRNGIRTDELARTRATVLHLTPFHSFPTGISADASKKQEYLQWAQKHHGILIEDDYDSEFTVSSKAEDTLFAMEPTHTVFYLNTFSRTISPSLRISYMLMPEAFIDTYEKRAGFNACTVSTLIQLVTAELIEHGDFERHINRVRRIRRRQLPK